jgi:unsaturated rhamnogalacturonyl hydrolase
MLVALYEHTGEERYRVAATAVRRAFDTYPRNEDGGFWHGKDLPGEMWIDGVFMGQMHLIRYGASIGDQEYCFDEAARQICVFAAHAFKQESGLYLHAWAARPAAAKVMPERIDLWADPETGLSTEVWSEGLGWYALILVEALAVFPQDFPRRAEVLAIYRGLAAGLKRAQDPATGGWFQVVDKGERADNWIDTSGTAMFTYALKRGIELGLLNDGEYGPAAARGYECVVAASVVDDQGLVNVHGACDGLCAQRNYEAYINARRAVNAKEAVAGVLWAATIMEKP